MTKKKIALIATLWILSLSGICFWSYKIYQNIFQWGYSQKYTSEEINSLLLEKQQVAVKKFEDSFNQQSQDTSSRLSRTGSITLEAEAKTPFWSWNLSFNIWNYMSAYKTGSLTLGTQDLKITGELNLQNQKQSASGSIEHLDLRVFQTGSYLQIENIFLSQHDFLKNIPREYFNVFNSLAASGTYLHIPHDAETFNDFWVQIETYKDFISKQKQKQKESLSWALLYLKTKPLFEVYKQEETRYYLQATKSFCAFIQAGKIKKEAVESPKKWFPSLWNPHILQESISQAATKVDFSQLKDCDDETYTSFIKENFQNTSIYLEKNTTQGHIVIELLQNTKASWFIDTYFGMNGVEKSIISIPASQSGSLSWSGVLLEIEQKTLSGYIDMKQANQSLSINFTPQKDTGETIFSGNYSQKETFSVPTVSLGKEQLPDTQREKNKQNSFSGTLQQKRISLDINRTESLTGYDDPKRNTQNSSHFKIEASYEKTPTQTTWNISVSGTQKFLGNPRDASMQISWKKETQWSLHQSQIDISLSSMQDISASLHIKNKEDILQNAWDFFIRPSDIIEMAEFEKKVSFEARKVARLKKIQEIKQAKGLRDGTLVLSKYERDAKNAKTTRDIRTLASAIEITLAMGKAKLSDIILVQTNKKLENIGTIRIGNINFTHLKVKQSDSFDSYAEPISIAILETKDKKNIFYQLKGNIIGDDNKPTPLMKGNYIKMDMNYPESLFETIQ